MKSIITAMLEEIYMKAVEFAQKQNQVVGEDNQYFITIAQLESLIKKYTE